MAVPRLLIACIVLWAAVPAFSRPVAQIPRVVNGITDNSFPYVVIVAWNDWDVAEHSCSGALIHPNFVLTAAYCLTSADNQFSPAGSAVEVRIQGLWYQATDVYVPTQFTQFSGPPDQPTYDFALIYLADPVDAPTVQLADGGPPPGADVLFAAGFGVTENDTMSFSEPRYSSMDLVLDCPDPLASDQFCAVGPGYTCDGDSGGPVVYVDPETNTDRLVGITSRAEYYCSGSYGHYTVVAAYASTISAWMNDALASKK